MNGLGVLGPFSCFLAAATWAVGSGGYSKITRDYSPTSVNFTRAVFALPFFLVATLLTFLVTATGFGNQPGIHASTFGWLSLSMFASYGFGDVLFLMSARALGVPGALAISSIYPIWTAGAAYLFRGEVLNRLQCTGLVIAVSGVIAVILSEERKQSRGPSQRIISVGQGVCLALVSSIFWALNSYSVSQGGKDVEAFMGNSIRMALAIPICACTAIIFNLLEDAPLDFLLPAPVIRKYAWIFLLETFGGSYFYVYGLSHSPLALASTLTSLAPVLVVPVALALKIERFSIRRTLGICLVVLGLCLLVGAN